MSSSIKVQTLPKQRIELRIQNSNETRVFWWAVGVGVQVPMRIENQFKIRLATVSSHYELV